MKHLKHLTYTFLGFTTFILFGLPASIASPSCGFYKLQVVDQKATYEPIENSVIELKQNADGSLESLHENTATLKNGTTLVYYLTAFERRANGCHKIKVALGDVQNRNSWIYAINDWCEDSELEVINRAYDKISLRCKF